MYKLFAAFLLLLLSCRPSGNNVQDRIITVSIAPFKYFVDEISGGDFIVNVMVPYGSDPHIYEPFPGQINQLRKSEAYISNGYLAFESAWLDRFYEINPKMKKLSLGDGIDPLDAHDDHEHGHAEMADPHYWVSPQCALIMASSVKDLLNQLNPDSKQKYESNYMALKSRIEGVDSLAKQLFTGLSKRSFMIFHPNLAYLARDYGLEEITVEYEGKEPSAARMKQLVDRANKEDLKTIFVQKEYDKKNAGAIADEIDAEVVTIDPLSGEWLKSMTDILNALQKSMM